MYTHTFRLAPIVGELPHHGIPETLCVRYSKLSPLSTSPSMPGHVMVYGQRSPASNDSILRDQVPRQPINQPKLPSNQPIDHSVDHSVDHSISISPLLLQPPRSRRVAVMVMMMIWWLGHAQNPFSGRCVTLQTVESRLTRRPSHPLPDNNNKKAGQGKGCTLCGTARNGTAHNGTALYGLRCLSAVFTPCLSAQSVEAFSGSRATNSILEGLGLDNRFFCCGGQAAC